MLMVPDSLRKFHFFYVIRKLNAKFLRAGGLPSLSRPVGLDLICCEHYYSPSETRFAILFSSPQSTKILYAFYIFNPSHPS